MGGGMEKRGSIGGPVGKRPSAGTVLGLITKGEKRSGKGKEKELF